MEEGILSAQPAEEIKMEAELMGKVVVKARIQSLEDLYKVQQGTISPDKVRAAETEDALVDTRATMLSLPTQMVNQLALRRYKTRPVRTSAGYVEAPVCDAVRLTVQGRECTIDVAEVGDHCPVLIGQVPLELLDYIVDPINRRLIGNPEHGGEDMFDMF
jgi:predicted aspartyl protease